MVHLHELLRAGAVDPTQHIEPTTGVRGSSESESQQTCNWKLHREVPLATTRGNFISTHHLYRDDDKVKHYLPTRPRLVFDLYRMYGYNVPGIFWRLCIDVVSSLLSHNVQCVFLLMIVHDLPTERPRVDQNLVKHILFCFF